MIDLLVIPLMMLNVLIASTGVYLVSTLFTPQPIRSCVALAVCFIMLSYVPSGLGFSSGRALKMAVERFMFSSACLFVLAVIIWFT